MREMQEAEAKDRLSESLVDVERGESIAIIRDGKKIAMLAPVEESPADWSPERRKQVNAES